MAMRATDLLTPVAEGLYSPAGDFFIDPVRPVGRALITHGHSDHARAGHGAVMATAQTLGIMAERYGAQFTQSRHAAALGETTHVNGVAVTFVPAGHVLGSAQILLEKNGLRIVVSGDYKRSADPTCAPFEPLRCHVFITEATFGLPVFTHPPLGQEIARLLQSRVLFPDRAHLIGAYSLGKAQRMVALLRQAGYDRPVYIHGALERLMAYYQAQGIDLGRIEKVTAQNRKSLGGEIILCPPSAIQDRWARHFPDPVTGFASGWMRVRARARQRGAELPLVVSDHADWPELCATIRETGAEDIWVTHGQEDALCHWCGTQGLRGQPLNIIGYGDEGEPDETERLDRETEPAAT
ncbi:MAG: ligase-associated DNA damage response exonuclease, partial [Beijerinckiaceae bacterium]